MRLKDKIAIVTGASSDIGASITDLFVKEGAKVVLLGRNLDRLKKVQGDRKDVIPMICDVTDESQTAQAVDRVMDMYGRIDILVNGVGVINDPVHFHAMPESEVARLIDGNIHGVLRPTKAVLARMHEVRSGSIVNIGSISGERAIPRVHLSVYSAAKAAVGMFTRAIAVEYARRNIRCNCVNPGIINSGMIKPYLEDPNARQVLEDRLPLNTIGEPSDVANAVLFLASDEARWITGTILNVDGGKSASES